MCFGLSYFFYDIYAMFLVFKAGVPVDPNQGFHQVQYFFQRKNELFQTLFFNHNLLFSFYFLSSSLDCYLLPIIFYCLFSFSPFSWAALNPLVEEIVQQLLDSYLKLLPPLSPFEKYSPFQVSTFLIYIIILVDDFELSLLDLKKSVWYVVNGAVMTVVFLCCRVVFFPVVYYLYSLEHGNTKLLL